MYIATHTHQATTGAAAVAADAVDSATGRTDAVSQGISGQSSA